MGAGVVFDKSEKIQRKGIEPTQVRSIRLVTQLDNGSANSGSGKGTQPGMLFGKTYKFKVDTYTNLPPQDKNKIKWKYKYHRNHPVLPVCCVLQIHRAGAAIDSGRQTDVQSLGYNACPGFLHRHINRGWQPSRVYSGSSGKSIKNLKEIQGLNRFVAPG